MKRIVNGWGPDGKPALLFEDTPPRHFDFGSASSDEIWSTARVPAEVRVDEDPAAGPFQVEPAIGGSVCRVATYRPGAEIPIHATQTVDYLVVVSGELTMLFEGGELVLEAGDVAVQLAAPHGWANRGEVECVAVAILLTADGATEEDKIAWP